MTDTSLSRQPIFDMEYQQEQSRLTTFFRFITVIPGFFVLMLWSIAMWITVPISWFALLFTGRYPRGLYDFNASFARYSTYVYSYCYLATDRWPGFSGAPDIDYPVHLRLGEPLPEYNRMKVLFRIILAIPVWLIAYAMGVVAQIAAVIAWFAIVHHGARAGGDLPDAAPGPELPAPRDALRTAAHGRLAGVHPGRRSPRARAAGRRRARRADGAGARRARGCRAGARPRRLRTAVGTAAGRRGLTLAALSRRRRRGALLGSGSSSSR